VPNPHGFAQPTSPSPRAALLSGRLGFLRVGLPSLPLGSRELEPLRLLGFLAFPGAQRKGRWYRVIGRMLRAEGLEMRQIPIGRPSALCLPFMAGTSASPRARRRRTGLPPSTNSAARSRRRRRAEPN
jgi:hypothetical protein